MAARREKTLRERVSSREDFVLGSVLGPIRAKAGIARSQMYSFGNAARG